MGKNTRLEVPVSDPGYVGGTGDVYGLITSDIFFRLVVRLDFAIPFLPVILLECWVCLYGCVLEAWKGDCWVGPL
jgi:hypothetical protein